MIDIDLLDIPDLTNEDNMLRAIDVLLDARGLGTPICDGALLEAVRQSVESGYDDDSTVWVRATLFMLGEMNDVQPIAVALASYMLRTDFTKPVADDEASLERCIAALKDGIGAAKLGLDRIRAAERERARKGAA